MAGDRNQQRGEIVLVIAGERSPRVELDKDVAAWLRAFSGEMAPARLATLAAKATGLKKRALYEWLQQGASGERK